jgi:hypothetical protein
VASHWIEASYVVISAALAYHKHAGTIEAKRSRNSSDELWHIRRQEADCDTNSFYWGIISSSQQYRTINNTTTIPDDQINSVPFPIPSSSTLQLEQ